MNFYVNAPNFYMLFTNCKKDENIMRPLFGGDENVLEGDSGDGLHTIVNIKKITLYTCKMVTVVKLYVI